VPPAWQLAGVFLATLLAVTVLTAIPSRLGARRSPAQVLQTE
jgi:ABC-type lipoprotein release transport system permease subunit